MSLSQRACPFRLQVLHGEEQHHPPYLRPSAKSAVILESSIRLREKLALSSSWWPLAVNQVAVDRIRAHPRYQRFQPFRISDLFRVSDFEFRTCIPLSPSPRQIRCTPGLYPDPLMKASPQSRRGRGDDDLRLVNDQRRFEILSRERSARILLILPQRSFSAPSVPPR